MARTYTGFTYKAGQVQGNTVEKTNILADGSLVVDLYYARNTYKLTINPNGGAWMDSTDSSELTLSYQEERTIEHPVRVGYEFTGWSLQGEESTVDGQTGDSLMGMTFKMGCEDAVLLANWKPITYTIHFDANGGSGNMEDIIATYDQEVILPENVFAQENFKYMGWNTEQPKTYGKGYEIQFEDMATVMNLTTEPNAVVNLYAVWDEAPKLEVKDRYFSLSDAQNGRITEDVLYETATAEDTEDGTLENGTGVIVFTYYDKDFTERKHSCNFTETYRATDSVGNVVEKTITVYIVEPDTREEDTISGVRFISDKYLYTLDDTSIWKTNPEYNKLLKDTLAVKRVDQETLSKTFFGKTYTRTKANSGHLSQKPEFSYTFYPEDIDSVKAYISQHGLGNSKEDDALEKFIPFMNEHSN